MAQHMAASHVESGSLISAIQSLSTVLQRSTVLIGEDVLLVSLILAASLQDILHAFGHKQDVVASGLLAKHLHGVGGEVDDDDPQPVDKIPWLGSIVPNRRFMAE
jgi:hypothetical protein